jgi:hypothetical protein
LGLRHPITGITRVAEDRVVPATDFNHVAVPRWVARRNAQADYFEAQTRIPIEMTNQWSCRRRAAYNQELIEISAITPCASKIPAPQPSCEEKTERAGRQRDCKQSTRHVPLEEQVNDCQQSKDGKRRSKNSAVFLGARPDYPPIGALHDSKGNNPGNDKSR